MKRFIIIIFALTISFIGFAQQPTHSIEYEYHNVGVFNPEWEIYHSLNPKKFEHITGYYREELAKIIFNAVSSKQVKIYDQRKREISIDTVLNRIIEFEKREFGHTLKKDSVFKFIYPYISAYSFEEFVKYDFKTLSLEKTIKAYCPTLVRYKSFTDTKVDTVRLELFWIFTQDEVVEEDNKKNLAQKDDYFNIPDTVISLQPLKYPVQNPYTTSLFYKAKNKDASIVRADGSKFNAPKEVDDLFILKSTVYIENEETGVEEKKEVTSDIIPEDITHIRLGELWSINRNNLQIKKQVKYIIPLYVYDDKGFRQLGIRIR